MFKYFKRLTGQIVFYGLSDAVSRLIAVLILPLFTRFLSPTDYGVASLLTVTNSFIVSFTDFGLTGSIVRFYKDATEERKRQIIATAQLSMVLCVSIIAIVAVIFAKDISLFFFKTTDYSYIVILNFLSLPLTKLVNAPMIRLRCEEKAKTFALWEVLQVSGGLLANLILIVGMHRGINGLFEGPLINGAIFAVILGAYSVKVSGLSFSWSLFKEMFRFGSPLILNAVSMWVINWVDRFILSRMLPLSEVGLYTLGYSIGMGIALPVTAFTAAWPPFYMAIHKDPEAKRIYSLVFTFYTLIISFFVILIGIFGRDYFLFLTPEAYHGAALVVPIIALAYAFRGNFSIAAAGAYITKKTYLVTIVELIAMAVNVGLIFLLVPIMGRVGAAWATAASFAILPVLMIWMDRKNYPIPFDYWRVFKVVVVSVAFYWLISLIYQPTLANFILRIFIMLLYPVIFLFIGFLRPEEMVRIKALWAKLIQKCLFWQKNLPEDDLGFKE